MSGSIHEQPSEHPAHLLRGGYVTLMMLAHELDCHEGVRPATDFDGESFILTVECADTARDVSSARSLVQISTGMVVETDVLR